MTARLIVALTMVAIVVIYALLSGYWTSRRPGWYASLPQPSWQPPDKVFGIIWPLNFLALGVASWVLGFTQPRVVAITFGVTLTASVVFALSWAYLFYIPHRLGMAAASLTLASVLSWFLVVIAFNSVIWIGVVLIPYAVWMSIATSLAWGYHRLVPVTQRLKTRHSKRPTVEANGGLPDGGLPHGGSPMAGSQGSPVDDPSGVEGAPAGQRDEGDHPSSAEKG